MPNQLYNQMNQQQMANPNDPISMIQQMKSQGMQPMQIAQQLFNMGMNPTQIMQQMMNRGIIDQNQYNVAAQNAERMKSMFGM